MKADHVFRLVFVALVVVFLYLCHSANASPKDATKETGRFELNVGPPGNGHVLYMLDRMTGAVYYAERTGANHQEPIIWQQSKPEGK